MKYNSNKDRQMYLRHLKLKKEQRPEERQVFLIKESW